MSEEAGLPLFTLVVHVLANAMDRMGSHPAESTRRNDRQSPLGTQPEVGSSSSFLTVAEDNLADASHPEENHLYNLGVFWAHEKVTHLATLWNPWE